MQSVFIEIRGATELAGTHAKTKVNSADSPMSIETIWLSPTPLPHSANEARNFSLRNDFMEIHMLWIFSVWVLFFLFHVYF